MALFNEDEKVEEILNINVEVKTNKGNIRTICFKDFKKSIDNSISIHKDDSKIPQYDIVIKLNCNGYDVGVDGWISVDEQLPNKSDIITHCFVEMKHKDCDMSFRTMIDWRDGYWVWKNGKKLSDKYEVLAWRKIKYPDPYKSEVSSNED